MTFAVEEWLHSRNAASLDGIDLTMIPHPFLRNAPLSIERGQALAYFLTDGSGRPWILKKFVPGKQPDGSYIRAIRSLVPATIGFDSGSQRRVLSKTSVGKGYQPSGFGEWLENTILMPRIGGSDWLTVADAVRNGDETLTIEQRIAMCTSLVHRVQELEANGLSHRDLSVTNVFIDPSTWEIHFIDWDSLYHASLSMQLNTIFGTGGYTSPVVMTPAGENAARTWCPRADRFAMAILCVEFLMVERGCTLANDGGLFEQSEIYARGGPGIQSILTALTGRFAPVGRLLHRALAAASFDTCPSPAEWLACATLAAPIPAPSLRDVGDFTSQFDRYIQKLQQPRAPQRPAPPLSDLPAPDLSPLHRANAVKPPWPAPPLEDVPDPLNPQETN
jgi:serine/threonine protein kinase